MAMPNGLLKSPCPEPFPPNSSLKLASVGHVFFPSQTSFLHLRFLQQHFLSCFLHFFLSHPLPSFLHFFFLFLFFLSFSTSFDSFPAPPLPFFLAASTSSSGRTPSRPASAVPLRSCITPRRGSGGSVSAPTRRESMSNWRSSMSFP